MVLLCLSQSSFVNAQEPSTPTGESPANSPSKETESSQSRKAPSTSDAVAPAAAPSGRIQYVGPDTYILLDADGKPQPVPGMTYEDFMAAWKKLQDASQPIRQPRYSIERIEIDGKTRQDRAELRFEATIRLLTGEPIDVPLGLVGAVLHGQPQFRSGGDVDDDPPTDQRSADRASSGDFLKYDPDHGGFVAQLSGRSGDRRVVSLNLIVLLARDGGEVTLPLSLARALSSTLAIIVETPITEANVSNGTLVAQDSTQDGKTQLKIAGVAGPFRLSWRNGEKNASELATVLSAAGAIRVSIDGRSVRSNARLNVQSYGGGFDRFRVRLPAGALLLRDQRAEGEGQSSPYRITLEEPANVGANGQGRVPGAVDRQTVLVELQEKQQGPVAIELATEQPIGLEGSASTVELAGFEVIGAVRQFGDVALEIADDWQARWEIGRHVRQVDLSELQSELQQPGVVAAFQYDGQPWTLGIRIAARQTRVHVTPKYELACFADEAQLTVKLAYQVFGARAFEFQVRMEGWELGGDPLESGGTIDQERIFIAPDDTLVLPLVQGSSRRAEIALTLQRSVPRDHTQIKIPLPVPIADSVGTGELIVRSAADVELRPELASSTGLAPVPATEASDGDSTGSGPELRFRAMLPEAVFVAERIKRPREISTEIDARVNLTQTEAAVDEQIDYSVRYGPVKELAFEAPSDLPIDEDNIEVTLLTGATIEGENGSRETPLSFVSTPAEEQSTAQGGTRLFRVALPQPRVGSFALRFRYGTRKAATGVATESWKLPMVRPVDGRTTMARAVVHVPRNLSVVFDSSDDNVSWTHTNDVPAATDTESLYEFTANRAELQLPIAVNVVNPNLPATTTIDRAWLQVWLSGDVRQDRAAFRFRTTGSTATVELPPQASSGEVEVLLDSEPADVVSRAAGRIVVRLPKSGSNQSINGTAYTLELRYRLPSRLALVTRHRLTPPQLVATATLSQVYWQVVLPSDLHIIRSPERMTPASRWQWLGSFWGRQSVLSQPELEKWAGASVQPARSAAQNDYLFTGLAPVLSIEVITAPRWLIVLTASSAILALVAGWLYLPSPQRAQRAWMLAAMACVIAVAAAIFPVPAMLLAQASVVGVLIAIISVMGTRLLARPARWPVSLSTGSSQRHVTPRADSIVMPSVVVTASTAPTVSLRSPDSE